MTTPFPLLRLPLLPLMQVCESMDIVEIIAFSILSKRTNTIAKHLKIPTISFYVYVNTREVQLNFEFESFDDISISSYLENGRERIGVEFENRSLWWDNLPISTSVLLKRTFSVFDYELIDELEFREFLQYDVPSILATLPNINKVSSSVDITSGLVYQALKVVLPKTSKVCLDPEEEYENPEKIQEVLIGNLEEIEISPTHYKFRLSLDDILLTNAIKFYYEDIRLTEKDLNRFLKLWKKENFNCRMEHLRLKRNLNMDNFLKGLEAIEQPETTERIFTFSGDHDAQSTIRGGHDIERGDGRLVTVVMGVSWQNIYFWP